MVDLSRFWNPTHFLWEDGCILSVWTDWENFLKRISSSYFSVLMPKIKLVIIANASSHGLIIEPMVEHPSSWWLLLSFQERKGTWNFNSLRPIQDRWFLKFFIVCWRQSFICFCISNIWIPDLNTVWLLFLPFS